MLQARLEKAFTLLAADRASLEEGITLLDGVKRDTDRLATSG
jgi:hypothetical protein